VKIVRVANGYARPEHIARVTGTLAAATPYVTPLPPPGHEPPRLATPLRVVPSNPQPNEQPPASPKPVADEWS
jgi:hypothetical protein